MSAHHVSLAAQTLLEVLAMLGSLPTPKKNLGTPLRSRKAMLETLLRHLDMVRLSVSAIVIVTLMGCVA